MPWRGLVRLLFCIVSIFKRALSLVVETEESPTKPTPVVPAVPRMQSTGPLVPLEPEVVDKFAAHFAKMFEESNFPGPDYFEFTKAVDAMEADIPSATARMKAAFTALKVQGVTKAKLVETANAYIELVRADQQHTEMQAAEKTKSLASAEQEIAGDESQIKFLLQQVDEKRAAVAAKKEKLEADRERLGVNIAGYQAACAAMVRQIEEDITSINSLL